MYISPVFSSWVTYFIDTFVTTLVIIDCGALCGCIIEMCIISGGGFQQLMDAQL